MAAAPVGVGGARGAGPQPVRARATPASRASRSAGNALSQGRLTQTEQSLLYYELSAGAQMGATTHFWITGGPQTDFAWIRYYIDGETTASVQFQPPMAAGVGFDDQTAPWGNEWIGKGSTIGGWYNNFRVPFYKSINVTFQSGAGQADTVIYAIVRGAEDLPLTIGTLPVPAGAKMQTVHQVQTLNPLEYYDFVNFATGSGAVFFTSFAVSSGTLNFMEGCFHAYTPHNASFPGILLSSGTEDYYDSAYYFAAGEFRLPVSGFTHFEQKNNTVTWSTYRFHIQDPLVFDGGFRFEWRNGDATDPATGQKCRIQTGGNVIGTPTISNVETYAWVYTW